jgi:hypothetical protein
VATFEVLPGLPPYGDWPEAFTETGQGRHREGYVVRFEPDGAAAWVGNFQPGLSSFSLVCEHLNGRELIVIAGGQGYIVDPSDRTKREYFGGQIETVIPITELNLLVFGNGLWFEALGPSGRRWVTRRLSWDGMRSLQREGLRLVGEAWSPMTDDWVPLEVDLASGACSGGSYNAPAEG